MVKIELGGRLPSSLHPKSQGLPNGYNKYTGAALNSDLIICRRYRLQSGSQV